MKITDSFLGWLQKEFHRRNMSYIGLSRLSKGQVSYGAWHKLLTGKTKETHADTDQTICQIFNVTIERLRQIAEGTATNGTSFNPDAERALALWRWLRFDQTRIDVLKALGYEGDLPDVYEKARKQRQAEPENTVGEL